MAKDLGWSSATTAAAFSISMIMEGIFSFVMGGLADKFGPRLILTISSLLVGLGYGLIPLTHSVWQLFLFYGVILGIGMGGMFVPLVAIVARWFTARRTLMTGLVSSGTGIGMIIVSPVAYQLILKFGWQTTFVIMGLIVFVVSMVAAQFLKRDPYTMGLVPLGEEKGARTAPAAGFSFREAIGTQQFWFIFWMIFWFGFYSTSINVHIVPDAIDQGMSPELAAYILPVSGAWLIIGRIVLGTTADKFGNKRVFILGYILSSLALFWIAFSSALWAFFLFAAIIGFSQGGIGTSQSPMVASLFGLKSHGLTFGLVGFGFTIGAAVGPFATGFLFDLTGSYNIALIVCGITSVIALIITLLIRPIGDSKLARRAI